MLVPLIAISSISFAALYPLGLWLHAGVPITRSFHRFTLALSLVMYLIGIVMLMALGAWGAVRLGLVCAGGILAVLCAYWHRDRVREWVVTLPCIFGIGLFVRLQSSVLDARFPELADAPALWLFSVFAGLIPVLTVYTTALGHWYLETRGRVPVLYLRNGVRLLWGVLGFRLLWDLIGYFRIETYVGGEPASLLRYMASLEGWMLTVGPLVGTLAPFVMMAFVNETLRIRSTTSATGMLYASMLCVLMGDLAYRFYLLSGGMVL